MGFGLQYMAVPIDHMGQTTEHMGLSMECMMPIGMGASLECMSLECMGAKSLEHMGLERMGSNILGHMGLTMGPALSAGIECMDLLMGDGGGTSFDHTIKMEHGNFGGSFTGSFGRARGHAPGVARKAYQILVRNLPFDFTWNMLKAISCASGRVFVSWNRKTSVVVQWDRLKHEEFLLGYYVDYCVAGTNLWELCNHKPIGYNRFVVHGLTTGEQYVFCIKAVNAVGTSKNSQEFEVMKVQVVLRMHTMSLVALPFHQKRHRHFDQSYHNIQTRHLLDEYVSKS
ncbi:Myomesin-2 [Sciurus carolinensis]|uniref:Myomesin-2 n=1 Tax=Sciurus carolinensis TaxID=30640 RepID=A0AA41STF2_SCICA|nr:Myomesin-2 [Sciurus carolinensis]